MNVSYRISRRIRLGRGATGGATGVVIAVSGVALALIIMEFTLAIVTGFKHEIRRKLMGFDAQVTVEPPLSPVDGNPLPVLTLNPELSAIVAETLPQAKATLSMRQPGLLKTDDNFQGVVFIGSDPRGNDFAFERSNVVEGEWPDYNADSTVNKIVLSRTLASSLGLELGSKVYSTFFVDGNVKMRRHEVAALYESNFGEYDRSIVYASIDGLRKVAGLDSVSGNRLDITGLPEEKIDDCMADLQTALLDATARGELPEYYPVTGVTRTGALYFNWLSLLDTNVAVIFVLMLCVAGLTLVSSLFILILERVGMIGILRAMGATKATVRRIFVDLSMRLVGAGMLIGNVVAVSVLLLQQFTGVMPLDPDMYYLSSVPVRIEPLAFIALNIGVALAAWLILVLPARLASSIDPAKTVNFE